MTARSVNEETGVPGAVRAAMVTAGMLIAYQVAGKATRDAFFLSAFDVTSLPGAVIGSAVVSVVLALLAARMMERWGPGRIVPLLLVSSSVLLMIEWLISRQSQRIAAAAVFLHFNALGALLISGFWSIVSERFDPRTAKKHVGKIGAAGTLGGLIGGIVAERVGSVLPVPMMLPVLATIHLAAVGAIHQLARSGHTVSTTDEHRASGGGATSRRSAATALVQVPYLRNLVALVVLAAITEGLIDFVFKARAVSTYGRGSELIRLFAIYYTAVQLVTFAVQVGVTRRALESIGLARTVASLPATVGAAAAGMLIAPGFVGAAVARGVEAVLHNSLYRSAYELLFTPIPRDEKRATKPLVDVGGNRLGDALGAGLVQVALALGPLAALRVLPVVTIVAAAVTVLLALHLHQSYLRALEKSLLARAIQLDLPDVMDSTTRSAFMSTLGSVGLPAAIREDALERLSPAHEADRSLRSIPLFDTEMAQIADLKSGDVPRVRQALRTALDRKTIAYAIPLLAWNEVAADVGRALRAAAPRAAGQLVDSMLDPEEEFGVRRRIPAILATVDSPRAVDGLILALTDSRFEVRYRAGRALARKRLGQAMSVPDSQIFAAVLREANVGQAVWESQRLLDRTEEDEPSPFVDEFLKDRANRTLEHVFTLLSLVFPPEPLSVAFRGLYTDDPLLRGTALEYLESMLPPPVKEKLWPFLGDGRGKDRASRPRTEVLADLLRSHQSIAVNLERLRGGAQAERPTG